LGHPINMHSSLIAVMLLPGVFINQGPGHPVAVRQITYVQLEREPCEGTCPWYKAILRPDGTIKYFGGGNVEHIGSWTAKYWAKDFENLARTLDARDFASMRSAKMFYVDLPIVDITVRYAIGTSKTVSESEMGESLRHWELAKLIDGIVASASDWKRIAAKTKLGVTQKP